MALEQKRKYRADGTAIDEKGDRSVVEDVALEEQGGLSVPKMGIPPTREQQVRPVVQPQVVQAPSVESTAVQPTQVTAQPQPVEVAPVDATQGGVVQGSAPAVASDANASSVPAPQAQNAEQQTTTTEETPKAPLFKSDPALQKQYEAEVNSWNLNGNVDMYNRPMVSGRDMRKMGWRDFGSPKAQASTATVYTSRWSYKGGGKSHDLVVTPIAADGRVLSPEKLEEYVDYLIANGKTPDGIIALDKRKGNLLIGVDLPKDIEGKIHQAHEKYYLGGGQPQNGKNAASTGTTQPHEYSGVKSANDLNNLSDEALQYLYTVNSGKEGANARLVADKAAEILGQRGKAPQGDVRLQSPFDNKTSIDKLALDPNAGTAPSQDTEVKEPKKPELTDEEKKDKISARTSLSGKYNIDISKRPYVSEARMHEAGWVGAVGDKSLYPQMEKIKDSKGKTHKVLMTPICPDGSILTPDEMKEYVENLGGADDILAGDTHGVIIKIDANDADLEEMDDLIKKAMKGELVTEMSEDEEEKYNKDNDEARNAMVAENARLQKEYDDLLAKVNDPDYSPKSVALEASEGRLKKHDEDTESAKKKFRTQRIIANIGDILQGFANLAGTWYGANSMKLTSLSGAVGEAQDKILTAREKRRDELTKSIEKIQEKLRATDDADLKALVRRLDAANARLLKYDADTEKANRTARQRKELEREKTKQQNQRRATEGKLKRDLATYQSNLRKGEKTHAGEVAKGVNDAKEAARRGTIGYQEAEKRKTKSTPSYRDLHGGKGSKKGKSGGKRKSKGTVHG